MNNTTQAKGFQIVCWYFHKGSEFSAPQAMLVRRYVTKYKTRAAAEKARGKIPGFDKSYVMVGDSADYAWVVSVAL